MEDDKEEHWALSHVQIGDQQRQPFTRGISQKGYYCTYMNACMGHSRPVCANTPNEPFCSATDASTCCFSW